MIGLRLLWYVNFTTLNSQSLFSVLGFLETVCIVGGDRFLKGMFGWREIMYMSQLIQESLDLFLMVFCKAESFGG